MTRVRNWWLMAAFLPLFPWCLRARKHRQQSSYRKSMRISNCVQIYGLSFKRRTREKGVTRLKWSWDQHRLLSEALGQATRTSALSTWTIRNLGCWCCPSDIVYTFAEQATRKPHRASYHFRFPLKAGMLISDRNRADLDWSNSKFTWRYRSRLTVRTGRQEFALTIRKPYASAEGFYESRYGKWSTTALYAGCLLPVGKHVQIDPYYEHENNTGKKPNQQLNAAGLILNLLF